MVRFIKILLSISLLGWLAWFEKFVIQEIFSAQTFSYARMFIGLAIFVLVCITILVLFLIGEFETWRFERLVNQGNDKVGKKEFETARDIYIRAQLNTGIHLEQAAFSFLELLWCSVWTD